MNSSSSPVSISPTISTIYHARQLAIYSVCIQIMTQRLAVLSDSIHNGTKHHSSSQRRHQERWSVEQAREEEQREEREEAKRHGRWQREKVKINQGG